MRRGFWAIWTLGLVLAVPACRIPGLEGPVSHSLATSRQLCQQGVVAMEREQWQRAEQLLQQAVKTCSTDPDSRRSYAEVLWQRGAQQEAVAQIEDACRLTPDNPELHVRAGEMQLATGQMDAAILHARRALELNPRLPAAWAMRGRIMQASGQLREALAAYHRALGYAPSDRGVQWEVADLYRQLDQPQRALAVLQNLSETYSPGEEPQRLLYLQGLTYKAMGRHEEAIQCFSVASRRETPNAEALCQAAECLLALGRQSEAAAVAREAIALDPQHEQGRQLLAQIELAQLSAGPSRR